MSLEDRVASLEDAVKKQSALIESQASFIRRLAQENLRTSQLHSTTFDSHSRLLSFFSRSLFPSGHWIEGVGKAWEWSLEKYRPNVAQINAGPPTSLFCLPVELLHEIIESLDVPSLLSLCLTSFRLLSVASIFLYREITLSPEMADRLFCVRRRSSPRLHPFLSLNNIDLLILQDPKSPRNRRGYGWRDDSDDSEQDDLAHNPFPFAALPQSLPFFNNGPSYPRGTSTSRTQTQAKHLVNVTISRFDASLEQGLPLPRLLLRTKLSVAGAIKQWTHVLLRLNPVRFQLEGPRAEPKKPPPPTVEAARRTVPPIPSIIKLDKPSRVAFLATWHRLKEVVFVGESVINLIQLRACLERSTTWAGRMEYSLVSRRSLTPEEDHVVTFGHNELEAQLELARKSLGGGDKVEDAYLSVKFVRGLR
ncbi:hypothetical protein BDY24DRAFT_374671 [Mrakia frigida]|uniref:uncharacterized protein n=1 Tax=Mrakia frigida TaxID=29902 RepID=UPI003FCC0C6D